MGLFGGTSNQPSKSDELIQKQYEENQREIAEKKKALYTERLDIIKSQGGQSFTPKREAPAKSKNPFNRGK